MNARHFGLLVVDKPRGMTSRRAVDRVAQIVKPAKAGHAGTLDPLAQGVLVVCVGSATRLIPYVQQLPKEYRARFVLGQRSDTDDVTGEIIASDGPPDVTRVELEALLPEFRGRIEQVPPRFSAVHVQGRRAYELARKGQAVELEPKTVEVHRLELTRFEPPEWELTIECGSGTYVRSIGRDVGERLGCGAVMSDLVRTRIGPFERTDAVPLEALEDGLPAGALRPAVEALPDVPRYPATGAEVEEIAHGRLVRCGDADWPDGAMVAVLTPCGRLAALARFRRGDGTLAPKRVFPDGIAAASGPASARR